jgi:hypothetical protein
MMGRERFSLSRGFVDLSVVRFLFPLRMSLWLPDEVIVVLYLLPE